MINLYSTQRVLRSIFQTFSRAGFSTYDTSSLENRVDLQKEKIHHRTDFLPLDSLNPQQDEILDNQGIEFIKAFNEELRKAKEKALEKHG